jgi:dihydroorotate dehydrogenase (fumarate)
MAMKLVEAGADGLVLFNRFYEPDIDLASLAPQADVELSRPYEIRLPLMWIALLSRHLKASIAATTGVWTRAMTRFLHRLRTLKRASLG